jgi:hypothetical protein
VPNLCLPSRPDLEHLKGQARTLQRQIRAGELAALQIVEAFHPRRGAVDGHATFPLADAQLVLARRYGFPSWPALRRHLVVVERYARFPHEQGEATGNPADDLLRLGCLLYGGDDIVRHADARALLADRPDLARAVEQAAADTGPEPDRSGGSARMISASRPMIRARFSSCVSATASPGASAAPASAGGSGSESVTDGTVASAS